MAEGYERCKGWLEVTRDATILLVLAMLLIFPGCVNERLTRAGFTKANIGGLEWEAQLENTKETTAKVAALEKQLQEAKLELNSIRAVQLPPETRDHVARLVTKIENTTAETSTIRDRLQKNIGVQQTLIQQMRR